MLRCALYEIHYPDTSRFTLYCLASMTWITAFGVVACATIVACLMPVELTDETFPSTVKEGKPVFVKFYAPWY